MKTVQTINRLVIKRRGNSEPTWIPLYSVFAPDGRCLEEFPRLASAQKWCKETHDFVRR